MAELQIAGCVNCRWEGMSWCEIVGPRRDGVGGHSSSMAGGVEPTSGDNRLRN
ncbi:hypothetical protein [Rhodopseudomonas sp.]|uniref:hypothetical protein n=1 Tax=Rhodopseudomonas sp. TaxID=1078 RepID=UPI0039E23BF2